MTQQKRACAIRIIIGSLGGFGVAVITIAAITAGADVLTAIASFIGVGIGFSLMFIGFIYAIGAALGRISGLPDSDLGAKLFSKLGWGAKKAFGGAFRLGAGDDRSLMDVMIGSLVLSLILSLGWLFGLRYAFIDIRNCAKNLDASGTPVHLDPRLPRPVQEPNRTRLPNGSPGDDDW